MRYYAIISLVCCMHLFMLGAMEHPRQEKPVIEERHSSWPSQEVITLKQKMHDIESSIMFFVPKNKNEVPAIGYLMCSCEARKLANDPEHKKTIACLFKQVMDRLASLGFSRVRFTAKLLQRPACLTSFINDPSCVPIINQDGAEVIISTHPNS